MLSLILSIILPILFLAIGIFIVLFLWHVSKNRDSTTSGTILFKLDLDQRRILPYKRITNKINNKNIFKTNNLGQWMPLTTLTSSFNGTPGEKVFRNAFSEAPKKDVIKRTFSTDKIDKKNKLKFAVSVIKTEGADEYTLTLSWKIDEKKKEYKVSKNNFTKGDVANNSSQYKAFLGFSLKHTVKDVEAKFAEQLSKAFKFKKVDLFFADGIVVIPFFDNDLKSIEKRVAKYIKIIRTKGYRRGINRLSWGSGELISKEINTPKRVNTVLKTLDFLINLSIRTNQDFISNKNEQFDKDEFLRFAEASQIFRVALRSKGVDTKNIPVRNFQTKRKVIDFAFPAIDDMSQTELSLILKNRHNRYKFIDVHATKLAVENKRKAPALIDINQNWLLENKDKIKFQRAIYVVNFRDFVPTEVVDTILELKEKGFVFAMRLKNFSEQISTAIMNVKPQFIVIDEKLSSDTSPSNLIQLISIKKIADFENAKLIFENPSKDWDSKWTDKIGIDFYYEF